MLNLTGHPHAHPNPPPPAYNLSAAPQAAQFVQDDKVFEHTRHVQMPFTLYRDGRQNEPSLEEMQAIMALFPTCTKLQFCPPFMAIVCSTLPPKPWPVTVAGIPVFFTSEPDQLPMDIGITSHGPKVTIDVNVQRWVTPGLTAFKEIFKMFNLMKANIHELHWIGWGFIALGATPPEDWRSQLPPMINKIRIGYVWGEQIGTDKAVRRQVPVGQITDDVIYNTLRPGIMIASKVDAFDDKLSTPGIILQSPSGEKYLTVAKRGFPNGIGEAVYQPNSNGRAIAHIAKVCGDSDIALAELIPGIHYSRETFSSAIDGNVEPFVDIVDHTEQKIGELVYMDTPFNGRCEGAISRVTTLQIPSDEVVDEYQYLIGTYHYWGNGSDILLDGCCGGVIWNDDHNVLGQFSFQHVGSTGECYSPSFGPLKKLGWRISDV